MRWLVLVLVIMGSAACSRRPHERAAELSGAVLGVGPAEPLDPFVAVREFPVPSRDAFPLDVAGAPDGSLWVSELDANKLGHLDPKSGAFREYPLRTPASSPRGLVVDEAGQVWFAAGGKGYIGKLFPEGGEIVEYPLPEGAKDPGSLVLGPDGILWFTAEQSNVVGELDRRTGHAQIAPLPIARSLPEGITLGLDGAPYVCERGQSRIARVEPSSLAVREYSLPAGARPRQIALGIDGALYYSDWEGGELGRLDPRDGLVDERWSPHGVRSRPYGLAATPDGFVWYAESGVEPNTLVRFDPRTKLLAVMRLPAGGVVRSIAAMLDGRLLIAQSGVDKVAIVSRLPPTP